MAEDGANQPACFATKHRLAKILNQDLHLHRIQLHVTAMNNACRNAYAFARWFIIKQPMHLQNGFMKHKFFMACLQMNLHAPGLSMHPRFEFRNTIADSMREFHEIFPVHRPFLPNHTRPCHYAATEMLTNYSNAIKIHCGARLWQYVNLQTKEFIQGANNRALRRRLRTMSSDLKQVLANVLPVAPPNFHSLKETALEHGFAELLLLIYHDLHPLLIGRNYGNNNQTLWFDLKVRPQRYLDLFIALSLKFEERYYMLFQAIPLWDAGTHYVTFDKQILCNNILRDCNLNNDFKEVLFRTKKKIFQARKNGNYVFKGMIKTDGYGVSVIHTHRNHRYGQRHIVPPTEETYIEDHLLDIGWDLYQQYLQGNLVFIDPNRRDIIFATKQTSTADNKQTLRLTQNQRAKEIGFRRHQQALRQRKTALIQDIEDALSLTSKKTCNANDFEDYLSTWFTYVHDLSNFYGDEWFAKNCFRRMMNTKRSEAKFVNDVLEKFGDETVIVMGDYSNGHMRFHEPVKGKGLRNMFRQHNIPVFLIDEFHTSRECPDCESQCDPFRIIQNPRKHRRATRPLTVCHGLIRCQNKNCLGEGHCWYHNRDLLATKNMNTIVTFVAQYGIRPLRFSRQQLQQPE